MPARELSPLLMACSTKARMRGSFMPHGSLSANGNMFANHFWVTSPKERTYQGMPQPSSHSRGAYSARPETSWGCRAAW